MTIGQGLTLVTGATGSGKSCHVVDMLAGIKDRPLFVMGIPKLQIPHEKCPPVEQWVEMRPDPDDPSLEMPYFTFPPNAIVVLDEAQRVFRPRPAGSRVPAEVAAFETRRHTGVDFVLITQHPTFIDANVRKLVTRHIHIHCTFLGRKRLEWVGLGEPDNAESRKLASRFNYKPPARAFNLYKSAEFHTKVKVERPWWYFALPVLALALIVGGWMFSSRLGKSEPLAAPGQKPDIKTVSKPSPNSAASVVADYTPRVNGLLHTAPVYDGLTVPQDVPVIAGCVQSKKTACKCYDQRGNTYRTTPEICQQFMDGGIFFAFRPDHQPAPAVAPTVATAAAPAAAAPALAASPPAAAPKAETPTQPPPIVPASSPWRFNG